jgi:hypothetical protein
MTKNRFVTIVIFLFLFITCSSQNISIFKKGLVEYETEYEFGDVISVLSATDITLQVVITEISVDDFVTEDRQLTLELTNAYFPTDAAPSYTNESGTNDITGFGTGPTLNGNQIINTIIIGGTTTSDEFSISEIPVHIPENISGPTDYQLILHHNLSGTDESVTLITFRYIKPDLTSLPRESFAWVYEKSIAKLVNMNTYLFNEPQLQIS